MAKKGVTVNAVAPALITDTTMLPRGDREKEKSLTDRKSELLICPS